MAIIGIEGFENLRFVPWSKAIEQVRHTVHGNERDINCGLFITDIKSNLVIS